MIDDLIKFVRKAEKILDCLILVVAMILTCVITCYVVWVNLN